MSQKPMPIKQKLVMLNILIPATVIWLYMSGQSPLLPSVISVVLLLAVGNACGYYRFRKDRSKQP